MSLIRFIQGFLFLPKGAQFLWGHRSLWPAVAAPLGINIATFGVSVYFAFSYASGWADRLIPEGSWYWSVLGFLAGALAFGLSIFLGVILFLVVGSLLSGPFNDLLGTKTLRELGGGEEAPELSLRQMLAVAGRGLVEGLKEAGFFLLVSLSLLLLGLIPVVGLIPAALNLLFVWYSLAYSSVMPGLSEQPLAFRERRGIMARDRGAVLGFGCACFVMLLIPLAGFFFFPVAVVAGAMLYHEVLQQKENFGRK